MLEVPQTVECVQRRWSGSASCAKRPAEGGLALSIVSDRRVVSQ